LRGLGDGVRVGAGQVEVAVLLRPLHRHLERGLAGEHVARQVELHRTPARGHGGAEGFAEQLGHAVGRGRGPGLFGDWRKDGLLVHLLKRIPVDVGGRQRAGDADHGREGGLGLAQSGDQIGRPRPVLPRQDHARITRNAGVAVGHVGSSTLVPHTDKGDVGSVVERVKQLHGCGADEAEDVARAFGAEGFNGGLTA